MNLTIGEYFAAFAVLLAILYGSWHFSRDRLVSKPRALGIFYAGVLLLFGVMVYGFIGENWWLVIGSMALHAFWMAWIRKRLEEDDNHSE